MKSLLSSSLLVLLTYVLATQAAIFRWPPVTGSGVKKNQLDNNGLKTEQPQHDIFGQQRHLKNLGHSEKSDNFKDYHYSDYRQIFRLDDGTPISYHFKTPKIAHRAIPFVNFDGPDEYYYVYDYEDLSSDDDYDDETDPSVENDSTEEIVFREKFPRENNNGHEIESLYQDLAHFFSSLIWG